MMLSAVFELREIVPDAISVISVMRQALEGQRGGA
jgi:hypothetical protein